jgi:hypothetical protein
MLNLPENRWAVIHFPPVINLLPVYGSFYELCLVETVVARIIADCFLRIRYQKYDCFAIFHCMFTVGDLDPALFRQFRIQIRTFVTRSGSGFGATKIIEIKSIMNA